MNVLFFFLFFVLSFPLTTAYVFGFEEGNVKNEISLHGKKMRAKSDFFLPEIPRVRNIEEDVSLTKYVGKNHSFSDPRYQPDGLVNLETNSALRVYGTHLQLRDEARDALQSLSEAFFEHFGEPIVVMSAYRSYQYQKNQISQECKDTGYCSKEGESEHQLGLAVDLWEATNEEKFLSKYQGYYDWLVAHAHEYGFHQSYQHGKESDGYPVEPWHWRYLGKSLATELWKKDLTFSQWYEEEKGK